MCVDPRISKPPTFPPPRGGARCEHRANGRAGPLRGRLRARRLRRRVRRAARRDAAARDRAAGARRRSRTSSTAALREPTRARVTAPASCCRSPTPSSAASSATSCPRRARYGVAMCFLPHDDGRRHELEALLEAIVEQEGQGVVCWRDVPVDPAFAGRTAAQSAPLVRQLIVAAGGAAADDQDAFERKLYVIRRRLRARGRRRRDRPELLVAHDRLQGDADRAAAARLLPRPAGRAHRRPRSRSSTPGSRRTPSRAGSSRTRTG